MSRRATRAIDARLVLAALLAVLALLGAGTAAADQSAALPLSEHHTGVVALHSITDATVGLPHREHKTNGGSPATRPTLAPSRPLAAHGVVAAVVAVASGTVPSALRPRAPPR